MLSFAKISYLKNSAMATYSNNAKKFTLCHNTFKKLTSSVLLLEIFSLFLSDTLQFSVSIYLRHLNL